MSKREWQKYNRNEQVLRTIAWAAVVITFAMASHPGTPSDWRAVGVMFAVMLGAALVLTRDPKPRR
jgi:hypothetical protein